MNRKVLDELLIAFSLGLLTGSTVGFTGSMILIAGSLGYYYKDDIIKNLTNSKSKSKSWF